MLYSKVCFTACDVPGDPTTADAARVIRDRPKYSLSIVGVFVQYAKYADTFFWVNLRQVHAPSCGCNGANRRVKVSDEYTEVLLLSLNAVTDRNIDLCTDGENVIPA